MEISILTTLLRRFSALLCGKITCSAKKSLGRLHLSPSSNASFLESVGAFRLAGACFSVSASLSPSLSALDPAPPGSSWAARSSADDSPSAPPPATFPICFLTGFRPVMSLTDIDSPYLLSTFGSDRECEVAAGSGLSVSVDVRSVHPQQSASSGLTNATDACKVLCVCVFFLLLLSSFRPVNCKLQGLTISKLVVTAKSLHAKRGCFYAKPE